jgi:hypothetical protein
MSKGRRRGSGDKIHNARARRRKGKGMMELHNPEFMACKYAETG